MKRIRTWLEERFAHGTLVASTPEADDTVAKNGLTIVDLLRPLGHVSRLDASIRIGDAVSGRVSRVQDVHLHFYEAHTIYQAESKAIEEHLRTVLHSASDKYALECSRDDLLQRIESGQVLPASMPEDLTPWLADYRSELLRTTAFGDHEAIDYPVAALFFTSANCDNPVTSLNSLQNLLVPPPLMRQEVMYPLKDPDFPRFFVLLQDMSEPTDDQKIAKNLAAARSAFGGERVALLQINTGNAAVGAVDGTGAPPGTFKVFMRTPLPGGGAGEMPSRPAPPPQGLAAFLSADDLSSVAATLRTFVLQVLLPGLAARVAKLDANVTATRRGLRNRLSRFWKAPVVGSEDVLNDKPWPWHAIESQLRQLADLAFLLRAYEYAAATYRLGAQDYQAANNARWYAGTQEMIALALVMAPSDDNDPLKYFARAIEQYAKLPGARARLLTSRCTLVAGMYQEAAGRHMSCSHTFFKAHFGEEDGRAAMMLEQSALSQLYLQPPSTRRFAFRMVLAGLRYFAAGFNQLGILAYRQVVSAYARKHWYAIEQHLHDILGNQALAAGDCAQAAKHFQSLLQDCAYRPAATQAHHLSKFMGATVALGQQKGLLGNAVPLEGLSLPDISAHDVSVVFDGPAHAGNEEARLTAEAEWERMEGCISPSPTLGKPGNRATMTTRDTVTSGPSLRQPNEEFNLTSVGEPLLVRIRVRNPTALWLRLTSLRLECAFEPLDVTQAPMRLEQVQPKLPTYADAKEGGGEGEGEDSEEEGDEEEGDGEKAQTLDPLSSAGANKAPPHKQMPSSEHLHIVERRVTLAPNQPWTTLELCVVALSPGWLRVCGATWVLGGAAGGRIEFHPVSKPRSKQQAKSSRCGQRYAPHRCLLFGVAAPMPRLELCSPPAMPDAMYTGEVGRVVLRLRNTGSVPCRHLQLVVSHPGVCSSSHGAAAHSPLRDALADPGDSVSPEQLAPPVRAKGASLYRLPWQGVVLRPGAVLEWPLWVHPTHAGNLTFELIWAYEPLHAAAPALPLELAMRLRTLRLSFCVPVVPLLDLRTLLSPCTKRVTDTRLQLRMEALKERDTAVAVEQVSCATAGQDAGWRLIMSKRSGPEAAVAVAVAAAAARARAPALSTSSSEGQQQAGNNGGPTFFPQQQQQQQCEVGEVCGHTLRPGVLLQPGQPSTTTLALRAPPAPLPCSSPFVPSSSANTKGGQGGGTGVGAMSEVPLLTCDPQPASLAHVPHQPGPEELPHPQQGARSCVASALLPHGAGVLPLPHAQPCSPADCCWGAPASGTFNIVAAPALASSGTVASPEVGAHLDANLKPCPASSAQPLIGGPLGYWYGAHTTPLHSLQHAQQQQQLSSCQGDSSRQLLQGLQAHTLAAKPSVHQAIAAHTLGCTLPSCVDPTVDVAVVWRVPPRGPAPDSNSSSGVGAAAARGVAGGMSAAGSLANSMLQRQQGYDAQGAQDLSTSQQHEQLQQQQLLQPSERVGILWLRDVLRTSSSPLPLVRTALTVAISRPDAPISAPPTQHLQQQPQGPHPALSGGSHESQREGSVGRGGAPLSSSASGSHMSSSGASGDGSHAGACVVVRHDFCQQPMCHIGLQLDVRNVASRPARLTVQANNANAASSPSPTANSGNRWLLTPVSAVGSPLIPAGMTAPLTSPAQPPHSLAAYSEQAPQVPLSIQNLIEAQAQEDGGLEEGGDFTWCGRTRVGMTLAPGMGAAVPLRVAVHRPGTICLHGLSVAFSHDKEGFQEVSHVSKLYLRVEG